MLKHNFYQRCAQGALGVMAFGLSQGAWAQASLRDEVDLIEQLKPSPPCCVIDARAESARHKRPLPEALVYRADLRIVPTAAVVVVADDNAAALKVADKLAEQHPGKSIYAVRGGASAWGFVTKALEKAQASSAGAPPAGGIGFVIPKNTCESGTSLQLLNSGKSKP